MSRILVIDDEPALCITFQQLLEHHGHAVRTAENGKVGMAVCRDFLPELVVTDMIMPEQDGFTTIEEMRAEFPTMPIIAMSGLVGPSVRRLAADIGIVCCVNKPIEFAVLLRLIDGVLASPTRSWPTSAMQ